MVVFGTLKVENVGNILFTGDLNECREYADGLDHSKYYRLSICQDDGIIIEKIVIPNSKKQISPHVDLICQKSEVIKPSDL